MEGIKRANSKKYEANIEMGKVNNIDGIELSRFEHS
jgi:hypothetical protein